MWNISIEAKKAFSKCTALPIHETDEDWEITLREAKEEGEDIHTTLKAELEEAKAELLQVLPSRFIPFLENGTLNQPVLPKDVRNDYLQWVRKQEQTFEKLLEAAYDQSEKAASNLPPTAQAVLTEGFHDAIIERVERERENLHLFINTESGFYNKSYVHLVFLNVLTEFAEMPLQTGQYMIYDELMRIKDGYALRVLFDAPESEWTISMESIEASCYYRPAFYTIYHNEEMGEELSFEDYLKQLNHPDHNYWLITPDVSCPIKIDSHEVILENGKMSFKEDKIIISVANSRYVYNMDEYHPINFIFTETYEDPYAQNNEPLPQEEIESAILGNDLELQVRAWNTLFSNPMNHVDLINNVLLQTEISEENEMLLAVFISEFNEKGILTEEVIEKFQSMID